MEEAIFAPPFSTAASAPKGSYVGLPSFVPQVVLV